MLEPQRKAVAADTRCLQYARVLQLLHHPRFIVDTRLFVIVGLDTANEENGNLQ